MNLREFSKTMVKQFAERAIQEPYGARDQLFAAAWGRLSEAFEGKRKNLWCGASGSLELAATFDLVPVPIETLVALVAQMSPIDETIDIGSVYLESRDTCTLLRTCIGGIETDLFPPPDIMLRYPGSCIAGDKVFHIARDKYKVPYFLIDACRPYIPNAVEQYARQLEEVFNQLEHLLGIHVTDSKIREVFDNASKTYANLGEIAELMKHIPTPVRSGYILSLPIFLTLIWGSPEAAQISQAFVAEIKDNIKKKRFPMPDEKYRVLLLGAMTPSYPNPINKWLGQEKKVAVVSGTDFGRPFGVNWQKYPLDPVNPFMSMAQQGVNAARLRDVALEVAGVDGDKEDLLNSVEDYHIDGIIFSSSWGCRVMGSFPSIMNYLVSRNIPCVEIQIDPCDRRNLDFPQIQRKIELFLSVIDQRKKAHRGAISR